MLPAVHGDGSRLLPLSALTGDGVDRLRQQMTALVLHGEVAPAEEILVSNPRHQAALRRAMAALTSALMAHRRRLTPDLVAIDVTAAVNALGEITGETAGEDLLQTIFSRFCIGK